MFFSSVMLVIISTALLIQAENLSGARCTLEITLEGDHRCGRLFEEGSKYLVASGLFQPGTFRQREGVRVPCLRSSCLFQDKLFEEKMEIRNFCLKLLCNDVPVGQIFTLGVFFFTP